MRHFPTVTAAIIAQNEAENLRRLLPRLAWVDQVVLVDGGSEDGTVSLAQSFGCCVAVRPFDCFAGQRNAALDLATGQWILAIDADERPSPSFPEEVRRAVCNTRYAAYRIGIRSTILGRPFRFSGTQHDWPIRLVRRGTGRWSGEVHETYRTHGLVGRLRAPLYHDTTPDLHTFLCKLNRYSRLEAMARVGAGQVPRRGALWIAPIWELLRRLVRHQGFFDGPQGWLFCLLSALNAWMVEYRHRRLWQAGPRAAIRSCSVAEEHDPRTWTVPQLSRRQPGNHSCQGKRRPAAPQGGEFPFAGSHEEPAPQWTVNLVKDRTRKQTLLTCSR